MEQPGRDSALTLPPGYSDFKAPSSTNNETCIRAACIYENTLEHWAKALLGYTRSCQPLQLYLDHVASVLEEDITEQCSKPKHFLPVTGFSLARYRKACCNKALLAIIPMVLDLRDCPVDKTDERGNLFLEACQRRKCHNAALCAGVLSGNLHKVEHLLEVEEPSHNIQDVLLYCAKTFGSLTRGVAAESASNDGMPPVWPSLFEVLARHPEWGSEELAKEVERKFAEQSHLTILRCLVLMVMTNQSLRSMMRGVLYGVYLKQNWELLHQLVDVVEEISHKVEAITFKWIDVITYFLIWTNVEDKDGENNDYFKASLTKLIQVGLATSRPQLQMDPLNYVGLKVALRTGRADLVKLWYDSGMISQKQMQSLSKSLPQVDGEMENTAPPGMVETLHYVRTAATTPPRLTDVCAQTISPFLGYRSVKERAAKAETLGLPNRLKNKVLLNDAIEVFFNEVKNVSPDEILTNIIAFDSRLSCESAQRWI